MPAAAAQADGSECMSVAGASSVAAYPFGELSGDNALLAPIELGRPLPSEGAARLTVSAFADYGFVKQNMAVAGGGRRELSDAGLSLSARAAGALLRLQITHRISGGAPVSKPAPWTRLLVPGGWVF